MEEATTAQRVLEELDRLGLTYELIRIDPEHADTATFCERYGYPLDHSGHTIIVPSKKEAKRYAACVVRADTRLDVTRAVTRLMGVSRLSRGKIRWLERFGRAVTFARLFTTDLSRGLFASSHRPSEFLPQY